MEIEGFTDVFIKAKEYDDLDRKFKLICNKGVQETLYHITTHGLNNTEITEHQALNKLAERFPMTTEQIISTLEMKIAHVDQEKVEVPELIDVWIKHVKGLCWGLFELLNPSYSSSNMAIDVQKWLESDKLNAELLAKAWFADDYTVKKEPLYEVVFLEDNSDRWLLMQLSEKRYEIVPESENDGYRTQWFTEKQIKEINKNYWIFKKLVEEEAFTIG